jgi:hypothetical protein
LNNTKPQTGEVYANMLKSFIADNNLTKGKVGINNRLNEVSRPMCNMEQCWEGASDRDVDQLSVKMRRPGINSMTYDSLDDSILTHNIEGS